MTADEKRHEVEGHEIPRVKPTGQQNHSSRSAEGRTPYERIKAMILSNAIPPDTKLTIDKLSRELQVSQTPVREALQRLEGDKLVVARKPRGLWTTPLLNERQLRELMEVRLLLEPWSARAAATDRATNPGREMLSEIDRFLSLPRHENAGYALASHDVAFHDMIFYAVGNSFLHDSFRQLHAHLHLFRLYPADLDGTHTVEEHRVIAEAVSQADPLAAEEAMRTHLFAAMDRFSVGLVPREEDRRISSVRSQVLRSATSLPAESVGRDEETS